MAPSPVRRLLTPASVAIVGASDKVGPGFNAWRALEYVGYSGRIHLVNPHKPSLLGQRTYPSVVAIPDALDAVFIAVPQEQVLPVLGQAALKGAGGAVILSSGFGEAGTEGVKAQRELCAIADAHGMAVCGPNCLGFLNLAGGTALFGTSLPAEVPRGGVAAVVQSGSVGIALLNAARGVALSYLITSGNEAVTTAADYLDVLVDDPAVTVVIAFLEQLRKPELFVAAARRARLAGKPVLVVKSGRSEAGRRAVMAHTGALAGTDEVCRAALASAGVIQLSSLDELIETAVLVSTVSSRPTTPGVAIMSVSGGEIALALDIAESTGLELPPLPEARGPLAALLPDFAYVGNPLDLSWAGLYDPAIARSCAEVLGGQREVGCLVLLQDAPPGLGPQQATRYAHLLRAVSEGAAAVAKPLIVVSNLSGPVHPTFEAVGRDARVPLLGGTQEGLLAVARFARWATSRPPSVPPRAPATPSGAVAEVRRRLKSLVATRALDEHEARGVLAAWDIRGPREMLASTVQEAARAAEQLGYPVVVKALLEGVLHKTEARLVKVDIRSEHELRVAAADLVASAETLGSGRPYRILVAEMVSPIAELIAGARVDPEFGPVVVVGGGGVLVELYKDLAVRLAPVTQETALEMIEETKAAALLAGWRGRPRGDIDDAARVVAALSAFIASFRDEVTEVEINPLAVLEQGHGTCALDCLIVPRMAIGG